MSDRRALAAHFASARAKRQSVDAPSTTDSTFDLAAAYEVEAEIVRLREAAGHRAVGRKVGYANKALWRVLKLDSLVWAHMYDDTVHDAADGTATLSMGGMYAPKIEPEIVLKLRSDRTPFLESPAGASAATALAACEWIALGFEIIDCPFPGGQFQPVDFVACFGLHAALVVGARRTIDPAMADQLPRFAVRLFCGEQLVAEGAGKNALRSPALALAELAAAAARQPGAALRPGEIVSTGTLTESQPIASGQTWRAEIDGLDLPPLSLRVDP